MEFSSVNKTNSITKSNKMIEAGYRLTLTEMQIVLYGISLINPTDKKFPLVYEINISDFSMMFNKEHSKIYNDIKSAIRKKFWERDFSYMNEQGKTVTCRWLTRITHQDKTGFIEIKFSEEIQPYLHQLQKQFTCYYINNIASMKSIYSVRFYEFSIMELKISKRNKHSFKIPVPEIRRRLELTDKYNRFCDFKTRVLEKARKEINHYSNIKFKYEIIKQGRVAKEIKFTVSYRQPQTLQTEIPLSLTRQPAQNLQLPPVTLEKAKGIVLKAGTGWDMYVIEQQFYEYARKKGMPESPERAFLGFVRKKVALAP